MKVTTKIGILACCLGDEDYGLCVENMQKYLTYCLLTKRKKFKIFGNPRVEKNKGTVRFSRVSVCLRCYHGWPSRKVFSEI